MHGVEARPVVGSVVRDNTLNERTGEPRNKKGVLMEVSPHGRAYLRPEGGGLEWDARIEDVEPVEPKEPHQ